MGTPCHSRACLKEVRGFPGFIQTGHIFLIRWPCNALCPGVASTGVTILCSVWNEWKTSQLMIRAVWLFPLTWPSHFLDFVTPVPSQKLHLSVRIERPQDF